jgi:periplasmic protein TonB
MSRAVRIALFALAMALEAVPSIGIAQDDAMMLPYSPNMPPKVPQSTQPMPAPAIPASFKPPAARAVLREGSIFDTDYPEAALRDGEQGTSVMLVSVGRDGLVKSCESGGSTVTLDDASCQIVLKRFRFKPARNSKRKPVMDMWLQRITWRSPE